MDYDADNELCKYIPSREERNYAFLAYNLSFNSEISKGRHCAVLLDPNGIVVDTFINCKSKNKLHKNHYYSVHAEDGIVLQYMTKCGVKDLKGYTVIVVRSTFTSDTARNSRPCKNCYQKCKNVGVGRIIYSKGGDNKVGDVNKYGCIFFKSST
jgi:deoxycytidylate deaminase